jgi:hypothetical protein
MDINTCQIKKGIFVLKECGEFAGVKCAECQKYVCSKHAKQDGAKLTCCECYANSHQNDILQNKGVFNTSSSMDSMLWYYATRSSFHSHSSYRPFNYNDYNNFDHRTRNSAVDDNRDASLIDS